MTNNVNLFTLPHYTFSHQPHSWSVREQHNTNYVLLLCIWRHILILHSHVCAYTDTWINIHLFIHVHIYRQLHVYLYIDSYIRIYTNTYAHINTYIYIYICIYNTEDVGQLVESRLPVRKVVRSNSGRVQPMTCKIATCRYLALHLALPRLRKDWFAQYNDIVTE